MDGDKTDTLPTWGKTLCGEIFVCFFVLFSDNALGKADVSLDVGIKAIHGKPAGCNHRSLDEKPVSLCIRLEFQKIIVSFPGLSLLRHLTSD